jgi:hypothetical protein
MKGRTFDVTMVGCAEDWTTALCCVASLNELEPRITLGPESHRIKVYVRHPPGATIQRLGFRRAT